VAPPGTVHLFFRWTGVGSGAPDEKRYPWPFPDTEWKGARVVIYNQNGNNVTELSRTLNGVDVGTLLSLGNNDPAGPFPFLFTDPTIIAVTTGDLIGYRFSSTVEAGTHVVVNFTSYFEFADGLWGF
jgi:hypothetical protein